MADKRKEKERGKYKHLIEYLENKKSFLGEVKSTFHDFYELSFGEKRKMADTRFKLLIFRLIH